MAGTRAAMFAPVQNLGLVALVGRRRRSARRAARPLPERQGGARAARPPGLRRRPHRRLRPHRRARPACPGGLGQGPERRPGHAAGHRRPSATCRRRPGARPGTRRRPRPGCPASRSAPPGPPSRPGGPVLVQVPRRGYLAAIACGRCRAQARCVNLIGGANCNGPLRLAGQHATPDCRWCGAFGDQLALRGLLRRPAPRDRHRRHPNRRGTGPGLSRGQGAHVRGATWPAVGFRTSRRW